MEAMMIPPIPELPNFGHGTSLLLSHLLRRKYYRSHYLEQRKTNQAYLILDNSAHESGAGESAEKLLELILEFSVDEVVAPDTLFDADATAFGCLSALEFWSRSEEFEKIRPRIMVVPQGNSIEKWEKCLHEMLFTYEDFVRRFPGQFYAQPVIGLSKDYETWDGGLYSIIEDQLMPLMMMDDYTVHLLGWSRDLWALDRIGRDWGHVSQLRGVDSAKPFVYAAAGIKLNPLNPQVPKYPTRPKDYFDLDFNQKTRDIADHNALVFQALANGEGRDFDFQN